MKKTKLFKEIIYVLSVLLRHIIIKLFKTTGKEKFLKEKEMLVQRIKISTTVDFSLETMLVRIHWSNIFKELKSTNPKTTNLKFDTP